MRHAAKSLWNLILFCSSYHLLHLHALPTKELNQKYGLTIDTMHARTHVRYFLAITSPSRPAVNIISTIHLSSISVLIVCCLPLPVVIAVSAVRQLHRCHAKRKGGEAEPGRPKPSHPQPNANEIRAKVPSRLAPQTNIRIQRTTMKKM